MKITIPTTASTLASIMSVAQKSQMSNMQNLSNTWFANTILQNSSANTIYIETGGTSASSTYSTSVASGSEMGFPIRDATKISLVSLTSSDVVLNFF